MDVTKDIYSKGKNLAYSIFEKACALYDADINDSRQILFWLIRDIGYLLELEGFKGLGFKVIPSSPLDNNFALIAGYGMSQGKRLYLAENAPLLPITDTQSNLNLNFVVSALTATTLTDYRRNMIVNKHIGQVLFVHRAGHIPRQYTIVSNTSTTFTFSGTDLISDGVTKGNYYTIQPSTPGVDRNDAVLLNVFLDEVTSDEDLSLQHNIGGQFVNEIRKKIRTCVEVDEDIGVISSYSVPSDYIDLIGNSHTYMHIGTFERLAGIAEITAGIISDPRTSMLDLNDFVLRSGDIMEGNLGFDVYKASGNIGEIDFNNGIISLMLRILSRAFYITDDADDVKIIIGRDVFLGIPSASFRDSETGKLHTVSGATPVSDLDLCPKGYVDNEIENHYHTQYLPITSLGRQYLDDMTSIVGGPNWIAGNTHTWTHNIGDDFLIVQVHQKIVGNWVNATGISWEITGGNTIDFKNSTGGTINSADVRVVVFKAHHENAVYLSDVVDSDLFDSIVLTLIP